MANYQANKKPGSYKLIAELGYDAYGKRIRETTTIFLDHKPRKGELELAAAKFEEAVKGGTWIKPGKTGFEDFVKEWKENHARLTLGQYTIKNYMSIVNAHLIPVFGKYHIDKITTMQIVSFFTKLRDPASRKDGKKKPLATNTLLNIYKTLKSIMDAAYEWKRISTNPIDGVRRPAADKTEKRDLRKRKKSYSSSETEQLIRALQTENDNWRLYFMGVLLGGYRRGEYLAVEWPNVDFKHSGIHIEKQISFDETGKTIETEVKTVESEGFVPMPRWYMDLLRDYKKAWLREKLACSPEDWKGGDKQYLFHNQWGQRYYPGTPSKHWRKFLIKNELPLVRLHDLRHTTARLLRENGADLKSIQGQLRHTRLATTTDIYMQIEDSIYDRGGADLLESYNPDQHGHLLDTQEGQ